ncbi:hypothetical protein ACFSB2_21390, partial [Alicyclobacillus fodiniaquatilis]
RYWLAWTEPSGHNVGGLRHACSEKPLPLGMGSGHFGGAWNFEHPTGHYGTFSTAYLGLHQVLKPDGLYRSLNRGLACTAGM